MFSRPSRREPTGAMTFRLLVALVACTGVLGLSACGGGGDDEASGTSTTAIEEPATTAQDTTTEDTTTEVTTEDSSTEAPAGDAAAGKEVYASNGCGACHVLAAAGTNGTIGPNLDERLATA